MSELDNIKPDDSSFNVLLQSLLKDLMKDLGEAEKNVKRYEDLMGDKTNEMNIVMYGSLLNDALKIKASVRDKIIKILGNLKDRVRVKEQQNSGSSSGEYSEEEIAELTNRILNKKEDE